MCALRWKCPVLELQGKDGRGSAVAQWLSAWLETEGPRVRASLASLYCGPWARHIYPILVLVQPRKTRPCLTERLLMGRKESNRTNKRWKEERSCSVGRTLVWGSKGCLIRVSPLARSLCCVLDQDSLSAA